MKIAICQRTGHWVVTTTDGREVFSRRKYITAPRALAAVSRLLDKPGHVVAFPRALVALTEAASPRR